MPTDLKSLSEFDLIRRYFAERTPRHAAVHLGIGDDCALLAVPSDRQLVVTADTLVQGVHFLPGVDAGDLAYKALAVNLSDLAAMGAEACAFTLALTLPSADPAWLEAFTAGLFALAGQFGVELCGGDTTRGPVLVVTIQAMGLVPQGQALTRTGAKAGDGIYLTGCLGDAGLGLQVAKGEWRRTAVDTLPRFNRPLPRLPEGIALRGLASACIDVSDGLAADLSHVLQAGGVGATLDWLRLPFSTSMREYIAATGDWRLPLSCGDDYELCFTAPGNPASIIDQVTQASGCPCTLLGFIEAEPGLRLLRHGTVEVLGALGYRHF
ncbi:MAG: thiamine-phosphate kinase [Methylococcaceae bacterium]|nr:MAG: thiamine-phosphate kinase [Methylococcaceae bacterium]